MATSLETTKHREEQSSALIHSTLTELKEFTQKVSDVEKKLEVLESKVLRIEKQVSYSETISSNQKTALDGSQLGEIPDTTRTQAYPSLKQRQSGTSSREWNRLRSWPVIFCYMSNIKCYWLHHVSHCSEIRPSFVTVTVHININLLEILSALNETVAAFVLFDKLDTIQVVTRISYLFF